VRLSDWLAPEEELVPFGPRAHARMATHEPAGRLADPESGAEPLAASGFWDGDTSVHTAVPGPGIFDEPGERTLERRRHRPPLPAWRPALPPLHPFGWGSRGREAVADLVNRISWRWAAGGLAFVALAVVVLVATLAGSSSSHRHMTVRAGIGDQTRAALSRSLGEIGPAPAATAAVYLRRLPRLNPAVRTIGAAVQRVRALTARDRRHAVVSSASDPSSSTTGSVDTQTTLAPTETAPAPSETEPAQTTSTTAPTTGGGGSPSGGGPSSGSSSQKQPAFGASGSLGPGSSPNG
jgi:hypothetical protein